jgi:hypothetical protein
VEEIMFEILKEASKNFADSIGAVLEDCDKKDLRGFVSKIDIKGERNYSIYLVLPKEKLDKVSEAFLGEVNYDPQDLSNEIANLIVGNSKVVAEKKDINYNISIPEFLGEYKDIEHDEMLCFELDGVDFYILLKERDGR